ncbi:MAG: colanic acid biosynthesis glycosyltransferase WcaL [Rhodospirillales bacterium]|nr:MAG: colanic acid biosynthesis glycosyltransferase WcaL [Rhodospirillales bacterium]
MDAVVAIILKGYPRLSETFIAQEIRALEKRGLAVRLFSLRRPTDPAVHPVHREILAPVSYLPEYLHDQPGRVAKAWRVVRGWPGYRRARAVWIGDLKRDPTRNRIRRFGQALVLAHELPSDIGWLHAHFLHTPASVTRYAALIRELPWSVSAHAKDVWTIPDWEKREKLRDCRWLVTCSRYNADHLATVAADPARISLIYHGLDLARFPLPVRPPSFRDGSDPDQPVTILSVGRAVEKKGYDGMLRALAALPQGLAWRFVHVGGGPRLKALQKAADEAGIAHHIQWMGALAQEKVIARYRAADLFVLNSRVAADGDRDGLPNVLMEAQSQGLACLATRVAAIPELILDGETGILVPADDPATLTAALERLIRNPALRARIGAAGMARVRNHFPFEQGIDCLAARFGLPQPAPERCASPSTRR